MSTFKSMACFDRAVGLQQVTNIRFQEKHMLVLGRTLTWHTQPAPPPPYLTRYKPSYRLLGRNYRIVLSVATLGSSIGSLAIMRLKLAIAMIGIAMW